jgi:hypothetical protein
MPFMHDPEISIAHQLNFSVIFVAKVVVGRHLVPGLFGILVRLAPQQASGGACQQGVGAS